MPPETCSRLMPSSPKSLGSNITRQWPDPPACQAPSTSMLPLLPPSGTLTIFHPHCPSSTSKCELRMDRNPVWTVLAQSLEECRHLESLNERSQSSISQHQILSLGAAGAPSFFSCGDSLSTGCHPLLRMSDTVPHGHLTCFCPFPAPPPGALSPHPRGPR